MATVPVVHVIWTFVTVAVAVPLPLTTVQVCAGLEGAVATVTLKALPLATGVGKVKGPLAEIVRLSPVLFCRTIPVPVIPLTVPPMVKLPEPPDPPDPPEPPEPGGCFRPLQEARTSAAITTWTNHKNFVAGFIDALLLSFFDDPTRSSKLLHLVVSEKSHGRITNTAARARNGFARTYAGEALHYLGLRVRFGLLRINQTEGNVCSRNYYVLGTPNFGSFPKLIAHKTERVA
jgi:hypothetical protein